MTTAPEMHPTNRAVSRSVVAWQTANIGMVINSHHASNANNTKGMYRPKREKITESGNTTAEWLLRGKAISCITIMYPEIWRGKARYWSLSLIWCDFITARASCNYSKSGGYKAWFGVQSRSRMTSGTVLSDSRTVSPGVINSFPNFPTDIRTPSPDVTHSA